VHNEDAGDARSLPALCALIERHGHHVVASAHPSDGVAPWHDERLDLIVAAGGDGTIAAAMCALATAPLRTPLAILPMGTANNIATTLDVPLDLEAAIAAWRSMRARPFDLGAAIGPWGERCFVESVGGGLVTHGIVVMDRIHYTSPTPEAQLARARSVFADVLSRLEPTHWQLTVDGRRIDGEFLLLEVLNVTSVGPSLRLAPASPFDGWLTIAAMEAKHRAPWAAWLRGETKGPAPRLRTWRGREIVLHTMDRLHVDDTVVDPPLNGDGDVDVVLTADAAVSAPADIPVRLHLHTGRVQLWLPPATRSRPSGRASTAHRRLPRPAADTDSAGPGH
jgi:diacylglycerol kinase family enzyme